MGAIFFSIVTLKLKWEIKTGESNSSSNWECLARAFIIRCLSVCVRACECVCLKRKSLDTRMMNFLVQMSEKQRVGKRESKQTLIPTPLRWCCRRLKTFEINWFLIDMPCSLTNGIVRTISSSFFFWFLFYREMHCIVSPSSSYSHV